jgi:hypothetical protein
MKASDMTIEMGRFAAVAPDNAKEAAVRSFIATHSAINAKLAAGAMTKEEHKETMLKHIMWGCEIEADPAIQTKRDAWSRRVPAGLVLFVLLAVIVMGWLS